MLTPLDRAALFDTAFPTAEALANPEAGPRSIFDPASMRPKGRHGGRTPSNHSRPRSSRGSGSILRASSHGSQGSGSAAGSQGGAPVTRLGSAHSAGSQGSEATGSSPAASALDLAAAGPRFYPDSSAGGSSMAASSVDRFGDRREPGPVGKANFKRGVYGSVTHK